MKKGRKEKTTEEIELPKQENIRTLVPGYDTKQSDGEVSVMLGPWGIRNIPSLPLLPGPLWSGVVAPDRALSMG